MILQTGPRLDGRSGTGTGLGTGGTRKWAGFWGL
jgi:hypothetical protein